MVAGEPVRVMVWNEYFHERCRPDVQQVYPDGIHAVVLDGLRRKLGSQVEVSAAWLDQPEHGLSVERLERTDVLVWWGHALHEEVKDEVVERVVRRVWHGMGLVALHSAHASKPFRRLMGTSCMLRWREAGERERVWVVAPGHPIVRGLGVEYFELPASEMYGEYFDIPVPDELVTISWFQGGELFRSGCVFYRGRGRIFYFSPGHETYPIYYDAHVQQILANAVLWAATPPGPYTSEARRCEPLEPLEPRG
ncbi:MAG: trehalose utilization protein ThuA [Pirellulaceae bacterium]|nr:MAG: trehalose utilization protein ThuA [Pirellulaceae bacterium]